MEGISSLLGACSAFSLRSRLPAGPGLSLWFAVKAPWGGEALAGSQVTETETGGNRGAPRARSSALHTIPLPPPSHGREAERAANSAPIAAGPSRVPLPGDPPAGRSWRNFAALRVPVPGGRALPPPHPTPPPGPCLPARAQSGAPVIGRPGSALCVCKPEPRRPGQGCGGRCRGSRCPRRTRRCHAPAARRAAACPSRYISAGKGTSARAEDEGARARAPAHRPALPSPRPARSPRPRRTRLRRSSSWSSDRGGSCGGGASAQIRGGSSGTAAAPAAMSCAEVMYHPQPYGAPQYLPNPAAAATCPTAYYHPSPQPGQQVSHGPGSQPGAGAGARGAASVGLGLRRRPVGGRGAEDALGPAEAPRAESDQKRGGEASGRDERGADGGAWKGGITWPGASGSVTPELTGAPHSHPSS